MAFLTRKSLLTLIVLLLVALVAMAGFVWSGIYNMAADDAHTRPVYALLETMRERSVTVRARKLHPPPDLTDAALIRQGAGNYDSMCTGCHLAPGMQDTELSKGLYPAPPALAKVAGGNPAHHFWVIKHGIKASGMPAWGMSMADEYIWGMVAFLQQLPKLDAAQYQALVASSGGHSHGGGETEPHGLGEGMGEDHENLPMAKVPIDESKPHAPPPGTPADHHAPPASDATLDASKTIEHRHADGTVESHPAPRPKPADDGHDHAH